MDSIPDATHGIISYYAIRDLSGGSGICQQIFQVKFGIVALPVNFLWFTGELTEEGAKLMWATSSEKNNAYFIIERSIDGKDFFPVASVQGNGNSWSTGIYSYTDHELLSGQVYYRLKQVDFNGGYQYSNIIVVYALDTDIHICPNPNHGTFSVRCPQSSQSYRFEITDLEGREVYRKQERQFLPELIFIIFQRNARRIATLNMILI